MGVPTFYRWLCNRYPRVPKDLVDKYNDRDLDLSDEEAVGLDLLSPNPNGEFDNLYLDMNGIIHPCCHPENMEQPESEEIMFKCILEYIDRIFYIVRPRKLMYLAIDGVAPRAKINQQRSRRFKSAALADLEDETYEKLLKEYLEKRNDMEIPVRKNKWDSNVITPGTEFMYKLSNKIVEHIKDRVEKYDAWRRIVVIFSDSNVPGEGEHKIMEFIRSQRHCPDYDPNTRHVLHGMDADLIMLGLTTHEPNFYIMREIVTFYVHPSNKSTPNELESEAAVLPKRDSVNKVDKYMKMMRENWKPLQILQLSVLREYLTHQFKFVTGFDNGNYIDFERCVDDLVLMIFFCGNDFLPNLPSISITGGSIDQLILLYQKILPSLNDYLSNEGNLNFHSISTFFHYLSKIENETFKQIYEYKKKSEEYHKNRQENLNNANPSYNRGKEVRDGNSSANSNNSSGNSDGNTANTKSDSENKQSAEEYNGKTGENKDLEAEFNRKYEEELNKFKTAEQVKLSVDVTLNDPKLWKEAYYREKFRLKEEDDLQSFVQEVSFQYIKGICWVLQYYYQGCPSWSWYYPYHYSPFCSDLEFGTLCAYEENSDESKESRTVTVDSVTTCDTVSVNATLSSTVSEEEADQDKMSGEVDQKRSEKRKQDDMVQIKFEYGTPLTPFQQLMGVMPIRSSHCIPESLRVLMTDPESPLRDFYPLKFQEDPNGKRYKYQWVALLPFIDEQKLLHYVKPLEEQLSEHEKYRNRVSQNIIFLTAQTRKTFLNQVNRTEKGSDSNYAIKGDELEYFVCKCNKKHRSMLLKGVKIPPKVLTVQDVIDDQRNRGFNCEVAKRTILNMLSSNRDKRDPFGSNQPETILKDTARDYHQYHNQYNPNHYTPAQINQYTSGYQHNYSGRQYDPGQNGKNRYQNQYGANIHKSGHTQPSEYGGRHQERPRYQNKYHPNHPSPYTDRNYVSHDQNYGHNQYPQTHVNQRYGSHYTQNHYHQQYTHQQQYTRSRHYDGNNPQHQNNNNTNSKLRRSSNEKYY